MNNSRLHRTYVMHLAGKPADVFPLLCPVREYEWIEHWKCDMIYSKSGVAELDCVFQTSFPGDGPIDTWVVSRYELPRCIEFIRVNERRTIRYTISLKQEKETWTDWEWTQITTTLGDEGVAWIVTKTEEAFRKQMATLEKMLNHYLLTSRMLKVSEITNE